MLNDQYCFPWKSKFYYIISGVDIDLFSIFNFFGHGKIGLHLNLVEICGDLVTSTALRKAIYEVCVIMNT